VRRILVGLSETQKTIVHENAVKLFADSAVEERRDDGGVHPAAQTQHHVVVADPALQRIYSLLAMNCVIRQSALQLQMSKMNRFSMSVPSGV